MSALSFWFGFTLFVLAALVTKFAPKRISLLVLCIVVAAIATLTGGILVKNNWGYWNSSQVSQPQAVNAPQSTKQQTVVNSPGSVNIQGDVNIGSRNEYKALSPDVEAQLISSLKAFKASIHDNPIHVRVDVENGSSLRNKVAASLGNALSSLGLGGSSQGKGNTFIGVFPDHPVTILCADENQDIAIKFQQAIEIFLRSGVYIERSHHFPRDFIRVYMYGQPLFNSDGSVIFQ